MDGDSPEKKFPLESLFAAFRDTNAQRSYPARAASNGQYPERTPLERTADLGKRIADRFPKFERRETVIQLLNLVAYLGGEAHISGGHVTTTQYLRIFLTKFARDFRAHGGTVFHYGAGCWVKNDKPAVTIRSLESFLTAAEGLFFVVAKENAQWHMESVLQTLSPVFDATACDVTLLEECCKYAKECWDYSKITTKGRCYNAHWAAKIAGVCLRAKIWFGVDFEKGPHSKLWCAFARDCQTPKPHNQGICFEDVYLGANWREGVRRRENNCYVGLGYSYNVSEEACGPGRTLGDYRKTLRTFVESFYYKNESLFAVQLANMFLALNSISTHKIIFEVGAGGDGKGMEMKLHAAVLGQNNCTTLDPNVFTEPTEFRKSGHFCWGKLLCRLQEMKKRTNFESDIWKRWVAGEEIDVRCNFGQTQKLSFGGSMKVQDCNFENIPIIERKATTDADQKDYCEQIYRRVICAVVGKATLTEDADKVDEDKGVFLKLPPNVLAQFLEDRVTAGLFMREYCVEFWKNYGLDGCEKLLATPPEALRSTTEWLSRKLSGVDEEESPEDATDDTHLLIAIHTALKPSEKEVVAQWRVEATVEIPGPRKKRRQVFADLLTRTVAISRFFF